MLGGFYTAASGILTKQNELNIIGNNLTNVNTPGYKTERVITGTFEQELAIRLNGDTTTDFGVSMATSAIVSDVKTIFSQGLMSETQRTLDFSINGEGFFEITGADGEQYLTRVGQFNLDEEGYLVLPSVGRVQGQNGDIFLGTDKISLDSFGTIYDQDGNAVDTLNILTVSEESQLVKFENNMYTLQEGEVIEGSGSFLQGILELSNVDMNAEMAKLIEVQRSFQTCSSALQIIDGINNSAITKLGSLT